MLPFEIRDLQFDSVKLSTIPQNIGVKGTKILGVCLGIILFFTEFFKNEIHIKQVIILLLITISSLVVLLFAKKEQGIYYCSFWVEGIPILWLLLYLIIN